jgi:mannose-6-phosphate isomerase-like protein (cupin superfamily)
MTMSEGIARKFGAYYWQPGEKDVYRGRPGDLYAYKAFIGSQQIEVAEGQSVITIDALDAGVPVAAWRAGPDSVMLGGFGVLFPGYQCGVKTASLAEHVNLPYVNGCATRQIFPPERLGDPTFQQLTMPPHTSEQVHHIHSTARVVYVLSGRGWSIVGQAGLLEETELTPGMVCILDPMSPHHFRTEDEYLTVLPVHVFSSTPGGAENNHPMFNGTKEI